ncbi:molybdopterin-dependent oxidoreductase [Yoonia maritima]|uniref:molybdopterin-dependent oxidoreductase n=1 Tax=Yoonia maritima TaxID=1435347 RepID=UPI00373707E4
MSYMLRSIIPACLVAVSMATGAQAEELGVPENDVVLTASGELAVTNVNDTAQFDMDMLMAMDSTVIETSTIWTDGVQEFEGVQLHVLLERLGVTSGTILATAINDYTIEIPVEDAVVDGPMIAYKLNQEFMSVRDKGPLWVVYPYDDNTDYRSEVTYSRSIWQLDRIEFVE